MKCIYFSFLFLNIHFVFAQNNFEGYYNQFDQLVGSYQNDLNTGERFEDVYLTKSEDDFRFFKTKQSLDGKVNYKGQEFYQCSLKYDLYDDNLLFENVDASSPYLVILDNSLVTSFSLEEKDFVRLPAKVSNFSFYKNGFFENIATYKDFQLFMKHYKLKKKKLGDKISYDTYNKKEAILLKYKLEFYEISSERSIIRILPEQKKAIKLFYKNNKNLQSQNKTEFMKKLFASLPTTH